MSAWLTSIEASGASRRFSILVGISVIIAAGIVIAFLWNAENRDDQV
jgi:hypothetical protein